MIKAMRKIKENDFIECKSVWLIQIECSDNVNI